MAIKLPTPVEPLEQPIPLTEEAGAPPVSRRWQKVAGYALALAALYLFPPETHDNVVTMFGMFVGGNVGEHLVKNWLGKR